MSSSIVKVKGEFDFQKAIQESRKHLAYYQEGLLIEIAGRVVEAMENRGITRSELARRLDVSPAYVTKILRGHANLSLESLAKIAFALDFKWECILMPKDAKIGLLSFTDETGKSAICAVEKATIIGDSKADIPDDEAFEEGKQTTEVYHELRVPA